MRPELKRQLSELVLAWIVVTFFSACSIYIGSFDEKSRHENKKLNDSLEIELP